MTDSQIYLNFINKIKKEKTEEEMAKFMADLLKFGAAEVYVAILSQLTEQDMEEIDKIQDEKKAGEEVIKRFQAKTSLTPQQFVEGLRDAIAGGYEENNK